MYTLILLLLYLSDVASISMIPSYLHHDKTTEFVGLAVKLNIGTPSSEYILIIDFNSNDITLKTSPEALSSTFSQENGGTDLVQVATQWYRFKMRVISSSSSLYEDCINCDGYLGLGKASQWWKLWPSMSFSAGTIVLGDTDDTFKTIQKCGFVLATCVDNSTAPGLCTFSATINGVSQLVRIDSSYETFLSPPLYADNVMFHNLYTTQKWNNLVIDITPPSISTEIRNSLKLLKSSFGLCSTNKSFTISVGDLVTQDKRGRRSFDVSSTEGDDDNSVLGLSIWKHWIVYVDMFHGYIAIRYSPIHEHVSGINLVMFIISVIMFVRWKMTNTNIKTFTKANERHNIVICVYGIMGITVAFVSIFEANTWTVLADFPVYRIATLATIIVGSLMAILMTISAFFVPETERLRSFRINVVKDVSLEHVVLTSMWLLLVERRTDGIHTFPGVLIQIFMTYNLLFYLMLTVLYYIYTWNFKNRTSIHFTLFMAFVLPAFFFYQVATCYLFFVEPFIVRSTAHINTTITGPMSLIGFALVVDLTVYTILLYARKASWKTMRSEAEKEEQQPISKPFRFTRLDLLFSKLE